VPFPLIGQIVEVHRQDGQLQIFHRGQLVVRHAVLPGQHQLRILPEHGPGAITRTARQRPSTPAVSGPRPGYPEVEIRDLAIYEAVTTLDSENTRIAAPPPRTRSWRR
jgi:hypothetical protein